MPQPAPSISITFCLARGLWFRSSFIQPKSSGVGRTNAYRTPPPEDFIPIEKEWLYTHWEGIRASKTVISFGATRHGSIVNILRSIVNAYSTFDILLPVSLSYLGMMTSLYSFIIRLFKIDACCFELSHANKVVTHAHSLSISWFSKKYLSSIFLFIPSNISCLSLSE